LIEKALLPGRALHVAYRVRGADVACNPYRFLRMPLKQDRWREHLMLDPKRLRARRSSPHAIPVATFGTSIAAWEGLALTFRAVETDHTSNETENDDRTTYLRLKG
jgi:hypothetical protein